MANPRLTTEPLTMQQLRRRMDGENRVRLLLKFYLSDFFGGAEDLNDQVDEYMPDGAFLADIGYTPVGIAKGKDDGILVLVEGEVDGL